MKHKKKDEPCIQTIRAIAYTTLKGVQGMNKGFDLSKISLSDLFGQEEDFDVLEEEWEDYQEELLDGDWKDSLIVRGEYEDKAKRKYN